MRNVRHKTRADLEEHRLLRIERTAIRIWELLERMGELSAAQIKEQVHTQDSLFDAAIQWLLSNEFARVHETPGGVLFRSN